MSNKYKAPLRDIDMELLLNLELVSTKVHPLPGATGRKLNIEDPRVTDSAKVGDETCFYEHIATVRHKKTHKFYVAFRETMDAFLARQMDMIKYPKWLMNNEQKQKERNIYVYEVYKHPKDLILRSHEDWLKPLDNDAYFDVITHFLAKNQVIDESVL